MVVIVGIDAMREMGAHAAAEIACLASSLRIGVGVGIGVLFLGETLRPEVWIGLVLVVGAVIAMTLPPRGAQR